jgi:DNA-binding CsgD family transcriptional regulator
MNRCRSTAEILRPDRREDGLFPASRFRLESTEIASTAEAVRHCAAIASSIGASGFVVLSFGPPEDRRRLVHAFDSEFPAISRASQLVVSALAEELVRHARSSTAPQWFGRPGTATWNTFARMIWCAGPLDAPADLSGLAFPVHAERGQSGLVLLLGDDINANEPMIYAAHARCFALSSAVSKLKCPDGGAIPSISKRELQCLTLTANGLTSEDIAAELGLSVHTANQYLTNTTQKLNAVNRMHAVAKALRLGLIE